MESSLNYPARLCNAMKDIYNRGLTTPSGGNLSICDEDKNIWVTPSGLDKACYHERDIIFCPKEDWNLKMEKEGDSSILKEELENLFSIMSKYRSMSGRKPSIEGVIHLAICLLRPDILAVVHSHSAGILGVSITRELPQNDRFTAYEKKYGKVAIAPYGCPGSPELALRVAMEFGKGFDTVILENHGAFVGSKAGIEDAQVQFEELDKACREREINKGYRELRTKGGLKRCVDRGEVVQREDGTVAITLKTKAVKEVIEKEGTLPFDIIPEGLMVFKTIPEIKEGAVICIGQNFIEAFDKVEVAEFTAEAYLEAKMSGRKIYHLTKKELEEIKNLT